MLDVGPEDTAAPQPRVEPRAARRKARGGQQHEGRGGQNGYGNAHGAQAQAGKAQGDEEDGFQLHGLGYAGNETDMRELIKRKTAAPTRSGGCGNDILRLRAGAPRAEHRAGQQ